MKKVSYLSLFFTVLILCSCGKTESESAAPTAFISITAPPLGEYLYEENLLFLESINIQPTETGFFIGGSTIEFNDLETDRSFVVCSQPGCSHTDYECPAYLGLGGTYVIYQGNLYATEVVETDASRNRMLLTRGVSDTSWKTLWQYKGTPYSGDNVQARIGGGYVAVLINEYIVQDEASLTYTQLSVMDLETGIVSDVMPKNEGHNGGYNLLGVDEGFAILSYIGFADKVYSYEEYTENETAGDITLEGWYRYLNERMIQRFIVIDLATSEIIEIAESKTDKLIVLTDPHVVYKGLFFYYFDGALISYDIKAGAINELLKIPNVINLFGMDNKLFYITQDDNEAYDIRYYDLINKEDNALENAISNVGMVFSLFAENTESFFGYYNGERHVISKEDFYSGYYEKAIKLNSF